MQKPNVAQTVASRLKSAVRIFFVSFLWKTILPDVKRKSLVLFSLFISFYALLCTVHGDSINQNGSDAIRLPWHSLDDTDETNVSLAELINNENSPDLKERGTCYIFILDVSQSMHKSIPEDWRKFLLRWYTKAKEEIDDSLPGVELRNHPLPDGFVLSKISLYLYLSRLRTAQADADTKDHFVIWTVGDTSSPVYPDNVTPTEINFAEVKRAIETIEQEFPKAEAVNTDFSKAFELITRHHKDQLESLSSQHGSPPPVTIIVLSDLVHDVDKKYERFEEIQRSWEDLKDGIESASHGSSMLILSQEVDEDAESVSQRTLFSVFRQYYEWYNIRNHSFANGNSSTVAFPLQQIKEGAFKIEYTDPHNISGSSSNLIFIRDSVAEENSEARSTPETSETFSIRLSMPIDANYPPPERFKIYCDVLDHAGRTVRNENGNKRIKIAAGEHGERKIKIRQGHTLRLSYDGRLPTFTPLMRFTLENDRRSYLIPIKFVKRLPAWVAQGMALLQFMIVLISTLMIWKYVEDLIASRKESEVEKTQAESLQSLWTQIEKKLQDSKKDQEKLFEGQYNRQVKLVSDVISHKLETLSAKLDRASSVAGNPTEQKSAKDDEEVPSGVSTEAPPPKNGRKTPSPPISKTDESPREST